MNRVLSSLASVSVELLAIHEASLPGERRGVTRVPGPFAGRLCNAPVRPNVLSTADSEVLLVEDQVVALPMAHRLAAAPHVRLADLAGELLPAHRLAANPPEALRLVALGRAAALLPASLQNELRRDVVCVPVTDAAPTQLLIAWLADRRSAALASVVRIATNVAAAHSGARITWPRNRSQDALSERC